MSWIPQQLKPHQVQCFCCNTVLNLKEAWVIQKEHKQREFACTKAHAYKVAEFMRADDPASYLRIKYLPGISSEE